MEEVLLYFACKYFGDWDKIYNSLKTQEKINYEELEIFKKEYQNKYITILNDRYPNKLKAINKPPFVLFYKGNINLLLQNEKIWYFGSYINNEVYKQFKKHKIELDINKISMITGCTNDFEKGLLKNNSVKKVIIIKDSGINSYISMNRAQESTFIKNNLLISEYPEKVIPSLYTWERSNKIKIGLSIGLFLISSLQEKMIFKIITNVIDENKEVFCYNKNIDNKSHNTFLINKGACSINQLKEIKKYV